MRNLFILFWTILLTSCHQQDGNNKSINPSSNSSNMAQTQAGLTNLQIKNYSFLEDMYADSYFPTSIVDKSKDVLVTLCYKIEQKQPKTLAQLYELTHAATNVFNDLQNDFEESGSELETGAREAIAKDFEFIAHAYGFTNADVEELIATRDW
jgi:hypothetical protein